MMVNYGTRRKRLVKKTKSKRAKRNTKKGGLFGIPLFKTKWDNENNWRNLWQNWEESDEYKDYDPDMNYPSRYGTLPSRKPPKPPNPPKPARKRRESGDWES